MYINDTEFRKEKMELERRWNAQVIEAICNVLDQLSAAYPDLLFELKLLKTTKTPVLSVFDKTKGNEQLWDIDPRDVFTIWHRPPFTKEDKIYFALIQKVTHLFYGIARANELIPLQTILINTFSGTAQELQ